MLVVRTEQMNAMKQEGVRSFEKELVEHLFRFSPIHCQGIGKENVQQVVKLGIERAAMYGFTNRGPVRFYVELMFILGSYFDTDPQMPAWAREILENRANEEQMQRADRLYAGMSSYRKGVLGPGNIYARNSVQKFRLAASKPLPFTGSELVSGILRLLQDIYPQRYAFVGDEALSVLIDRGKLNAEKFVLATTRGITLCTLLMFQLGHGCFDDPLYPWISKTLAELRSDDPTERSHRLERRALAYLDVIVKRLGQE